MIVIIRILSNSTVVLIASEWNKTSFDVIIPFTFIYYVIFIFIRLFIGSSICPMANKIDR